MAQYLTRTTPHRAEPKFVPSGYDLWFITFRISRCIALVLFIPEQTFRDDSGFIFRGVGQSELSEDDVGKETLPSRHNSMVRHFWYVGFYRTSVLSSAFISLTQI